MRKYSFSSQTRKPLFLASLAVSLALHAGGLYFLFKHPFSFFSSKSSDEKNQTLVQTLEKDLEIEFALTETLSRLIIKDEQHVPPSFDRPNLEIADQELNIITNFSYTPKVSSSSTPSPFHLEDPTYAISESEEYAILKPSAFGLKKWINFSQQLEIEMEPLAAVEEPSEERAAPYTLPKLEKQDQLSQVQEVGKIPLSVPKTPSEVPFAFNLPEEPVSEIITPEVKMQKQKTEKKVRIEKPLTLSPLAASAAQSSKKNAFLADPSQEKREIEIFDRETFYFFYNGELKSSHSPELQTTHPLAKALYKKPFLPPKKNLLPKTRIGGHFFASIVPLDLSSLSEANDLYIAEPFNEDVSRLTPPKKNLPHTRIPDTSSSQMMFEFREVAPPSEILKNSFKAPTPYLAKSFGTTFPTDLPDLPEGSSALFVRSSAFLPEKERVQYLEILESLTRKRLNQIVTMPPSLPFDFSIESETLFASTWMPPKQEMTLTFSSFSLPKSSFTAKSASVKPHAKQVVEAKPEKEQVQALAHSNSYEALTNQMQSPAFEKNSSIAFAPQATFAYPLVPAQLDFPHAPLQKPPSNWEQIEMPEFMPYIETHVATKQTKPKREEVKKTEYESTLALDLNSIDSSKKQLYNSEDPDSLPLSPSRSTLPKQKLSKLPSALTMKRQVSSPEEVRYDSKLHTETLQPKEEALALILDTALPAELSHPTLPRYLMKRFPEKSTQFELSETKVNVTPRVQQTPDLAVLQKGKIGVSPASVEKQFFLSTPPLAQATEDKPLAKPEKEAALPLVPKRERRKLRIPRIATSKIPHLDFDEDKLAIKDEEFDFLKRDIETQELLAMPHLPYLQEKKVFSNKVPFKPTKALTELPEIDTFFALIPRQEAFPNMKQLLSKTPLPRSEVTKDVQPEIALATDVKEPETKDIRSQAKALIKKHHEETLTKNKSIEMSTPEIAKTFNEKDAHVLNETHRFTQGYLSEIPETASLDTISFNNDFETTVTYVEKPDGKGYHFALKIKPSEKLYLGSPNQNFVFIVDGSSSIKKHRYNTFKDAVIKSLSYMHDGDSFNILVADSQIAAMSEKPLAWNKGIIRKAQNYLQKRMYRGYFSNYDAFYLLSKATQYFDPNKENIVIFITDGHSLESIKAHKEPFKELAQGNKGRFSLFTASASQGNNITMLDLISTFNNGEFMYSQTNAAFPRKLAVLVKHIESFIAKDIRLHITSASNNLDVQFYPNQESYPSLYADHPYTLYGSIDKLEDFDLILQGRSGDQWVNIKQRVSFQNAEVAGYNLRRNFALQQAYVCYDYYLKKDDPFFLAEAERILTPHALTPATR